MTIYVVVMSRTRSPDFAGGHHTNMRSTPCTAIPHHGGVYRRQILVIVDNCRNLGGFIGIANAGEELP